MKRLTSPSLAKLKEFLKTEPSLLIEELWETPKAALIALIAKATKKHVLVITSESKEEKITGDLSFFSDAPLLEFPSWETFPEEEIAPSPDIIGKRLEILHQLATSSEPHILFCPLQAVLQLLPDPQTTSSSCTKWSVGDEIPFETLIPKLVELGYHREAVTSDKGEFSFRGGIIDLFPISSKEPYRVDFFGDRIEQIRTFDPTSQKSTGKVTSLFLSPASEIEMLRAEKNPSTLFDYLGDNTFLILDELADLEDRSVALKKSPALIPFGELLKVVAPLQKMLWTKLPVEALSEVHYEKSSARSPLLSLSFHIFNHQVTTKRWRSPFLPLHERLTPFENRAAANPEELLHGLHEHAGEDFNLRLICSTESEEKTLKEKLKKQEISLPQKTTYERGYLSHGIAFTDSYDLLFPMTELTKRYKVRRTQWRTTCHTPAAEFHQLAVGDLVVHFHNGIGKYLGTDKKVDHLGAENEFMVIEYAKESKLFVPVSQSYLVSRYIGSHDEAPPLHDIGSKKWQRSKEKTQQSIVGYAHDLLKLQAQREMKGGIAFPKDSEETLIFENDFPFEETPDQKSSIEDIKKEMSSEKAMDRLLCGDVGYGKTEVAMRAAFKAVADGKKQVAILVPTTVLALQHFETFSERMANFPINVAMVSRFRKPKQIKKTLEGISEGKVDILIGTHRLLSKDITFKDLGLIIIDEEQRFGVRAKEHLKKLKVGVDCLSLSATPIPRTLYLSLIGARAISSINTPPFDRLPIKTIIAERNTKLIQNALLRELARDGQSFFIHNRVQSIYKVSAEIQKLVPEARIITGHGQMSADELDTIFHAFKSGEADILVSTTIVENGVDIPNANTILIDSAHQFGLSELYQLKGRVGRWNRPAYAYFLIPEQRTLPEIVQRRLSALVEASGFGGGIKIAMRDLEIRGAGDILGAKQSGHVSSVGFHLYCKLLRRTIDALRKNSSPTFTEAKLEFPYPAKLPETYINEPSLRMELYHRLGETTTNQELGDILSEMQDRFGEPPKPVIWLYHISRLRLLANQHRLALLKIDKLTFTTQTLTGKKQTHTMIRSQDPAAIEAHIKKALQETWRA